MKSLITISKYYWLYLCQISLQIMLLPTLILHLDEIIKSAVVIRNFFSLHPATREPSLSERARKQWKKLIDVHENSSFKRQKKTRRCASQRLMGKTVAAPHFNRDTVDFASRERDESNPGIKTLLPFLKKSYGTERLGEFSRSHGGLRCLLLAS